MDEVEEKGEGNGSFVRSFEEIPRERGNERTRGRNSFSTRPACCIYVVLRCVVKPSRTLEYIRHEASNLEM